MAGTKFELKNENNTLSLITKGGVIIDHIGDKGLLSISFENHDDMNEYLKADLKLKRDFVVTLIEMGDQIIVNPPGFIVTLPWVMDKLICAGG